MTKENHKLNHPSRIATIAVLSLLSAGTAHSQEFLIKNLITDDPTVNQAALTDPNAVNVWGISHSGGSPFWVSDNGTGGTTVYTVNPATDQVTKDNVGGVPIITIPGSTSVSGPTGQVSTAGDVAGSFHGDNFLFVSESGVIAGWRGALGGTAEVFQPAAFANVYKGSAIANVTIQGSTNSYLYAANFRNNSIDIVKGTASAPNLPGAFIDPNAIAGYAPFNIQNLVVNGVTELFVTYAEQDPASQGHDEVDGAGLGYVDAFDTQGNFLGRVGTQGTLDAPWGLSIAPSSFGSYAGDLLVGNFGDGTINAYNLNTDSFVGQLDGINGAPLSIDGLWGLIPGNNGGAGSSSRIYFSAGPNGEADGLFGSIAAVPEPGVNAMLAAGLLSTGLLMARRTRKRA
jgi:uncharacterized protein (TIGR03118 family)